jgi:hypothetical protein
MEFTMSLPDSKVVYTFYPFMKQPGNGTLFFEVVDGNGDFVAYAQEDKIGILSIWTIDNDFGAWGQGYDVESALIAFLKS